MSLPYLSIPTELECQELSASSSSSSFYSNSSSSLFSRGPSANSSMTDLSRSSSPNLSEPKSTETTTMKSTAASYAMSIANLLNPFPESPDFHIEEDAFYDTSPSSGDRVPKRKVGLWDHLAEYTPSFMVPAKRRREMTSEEMEADLERRWKKMCPNGPATLVCDMDFSEQEEFDWYPQRDDSALGLGIGLELPTEHSLHSVDPTPLRVWEKDCGRQRSLLRPTLLKDDMSPIIPLPSCLVTVPVLQSATLLTSSPFSVSSPIGRLPSPHWSDEILGMYTSESKSEFVEVPLCSPVLGVGEAVAYIREPDSIYAAEPTTTSPEEQHSKDSNFTSLPRYGTTKHAAEGLGLGLPSTFRHAEKKVAEEHHEMQRTPEQKSESVLSPTTRANSMSVASVPATSRSKHSLAGLGLGHPSTQAGPAPRSENVEAARPIQPRRFTGIFTCKVSTFPKRYLYSIPESPLLRPRSASTPKPQAGRFSSKTFHNLQTGSQSKFSWFSKAEPSNTNTPASTAEQNIENPKTRTSGPGYQRIKRSTQTRKLLSMEEKEHMVMGLGSQSHGENEPKYVGGMKMLF